MHRTGTKVHHNHVHDFSVTTTAICSFNRQRRGQDLVHCFGNVTDDLQSTTDVSTVNGVYATYVAAKQDEVT
jgi:hypothetical protein